MANNFLQFSAEIPKLKKEEREWCEGHLSLFGHDAPQEGDKGYEEFTELIGVYELEDEEDTLGFNCEFEDDGLWIYAEMNGNVDHVVAFAQMFLKKFRPEDAFAMSWASTCSRMVLGGFGGGAIFVTANKIEWMNSYDWAEEKWKAFRKKQKAS